MTTELEEIKQEIAAVKFVLESFAEYDVQSERLIYLKQNVASIPFLKTYLTYKTEESLQGQLDRLYEDKSQLQEEKLLLLKATPNG